MDGDDQNILSLPLVAHRSSFALALRDAVLLADSLERRTFK